MKESPVESAGPVAGEPATGDSGRAAPEPGAQPDPPQGLGVGVARLPAARTVLKWVYAGRSVLAAGSFLYIASIWDQAGPEVTLAASLILTATLVWTTYSFWHTHLADHTPGRNFLYGQAIFDLLLVTWIVHLTGGSETPFAPLYILVICAAAIMLPLLGGVLVGLLASALYVAEVVWNSQGAVNGHVILQLTLFTVVALLTGYLVDRLRQTGTALDEVESKLELLRLNTDDILGSIRTGIITVDGEGRLAYMNPAATEILSLTPAVWLGRPVVDALNQAAPGLGWVIEQTQRERRPIARFESGDLLEGTFVLGVSTTVMEREGDDRPAVTAIFQDITEKTRIEQLERRAERLEAVAELSASLAHEIKNPLASIRSAVEQLADSRVDADDRRILNALVVRESGRLTRLLAEFIDFARAKITVPTPVEFCAIVREVVTLVRTHPDADGRSVSLTLPRDDEEIWLRGSEDLLNRAVLNLVLNAAQWAGRDGSVDVRVELVRSDILSPVLGTHDLVRLTVSDDGPGIEPSVAENIFNPFFTRRPGGTGLGLALVQRAADAHGGIVFVDPVRGPGARGAVFTFCLPYRAGGVAEGEATTEAVEASL
jgi:two-component system, NtrC family, sensor histidine kinase PilS